MKNELYGVQQLDHTGSIHHEMEQSLQYPIILDLRVSQVESRLRGVEQLAGQEHLHV